MIVIGSETVIVLIKNQIILITSFIGYREEFMLKNVKNYSESFPVGVTFKLQHMQSNSVSPLKYGGTCFRKGFSWRRKLFYANLWGRRWSFTNLNTLNPEIPPQPWLDIHLKMMPWPVKRQSKELWNVLSSRLIFM